MKERIANRFESWRDLYGLSESARVQRAVIAHAVAGKHGDPATWDRKAVIDTVDTTAPPVDGSAPTKAAHRRFKTWQSERISFIACVLGPEPIEPTEDDYAAVLVAIDLVEGARADEAGALLAKEAPRRHNRACPACGAIAGMPCREPGPVEAEQFKGADWMTQKGWVGVRKNGERLIPHLSRVEPRSTP